jgi:hypothetical protein
VKPPADLLSAPGDVIEDADLARINAFLAGEDLRAAFRPDQARDSDGKWTKDGGTPVADRVARAKATHIPSTREVQQQATVSEQIVAKILRGKSTDDHEPMDVVIRANEKVLGIEVKTIVAGKNDKITIHPESLSRKQAWVKEHNATGHTIAIDLRGGSRTFYYRGGFGSFRLSSMQRVSLKQLRELVK